MVVSFVSEKGGTGKSTLAVSVATEWMARGLRVLLVDADPQRTARIACLEAREHGRLAPDCITGTATMARHLERFRPAYERIVIDTHGRLDDVHRAALLYSDVALVPLGPAGPDVWAARSVVDSIRAVQKTRPQLKAALVLAKLVTRTTLAAGARDVLKPLGFPVFKAATHHRTAWAEALTLGQGVAQYQPNSPAADELRAVVAELNRFGGKA